MITITMPDGTKIEGNKDDVLDAYECIMQSRMHQIMPTYVLPDDYPMSKMPWEPNVIWATIQ